MDLPSKEPVGGLLVETTKLPLGVGGYSPLTTRHSRYGLPFRIRATTIGLHDGHTPLSTVPAQKGWQEY
jgi:hypothetical protein